MLKTKFGQLVAGTKYEKYAIDNQFMLDNNTFIQKKSATAKFSFCFIYNNNTFGVWTDYYNTLIYVSKDYDKNTPYKFTFNFNEHNENTELLTSVKKYRAWKTFIDFYKYRKRTF